MTLTDVAKWARQRMQWFQHEGQPWGAMAAECRKIAEAVEQFTWQPMATAPKDGTEILYADAEGYVGVTHWMAIQAAWFDYNDDGIDRDLYGKQTPVVWMHKPEAPK